MIKILDKNFDSGSFDDLAQHPLQSWKWGEAKNAMGNEVIRLGEFEKDKMINVFQMTLHPIPYTKLKLGYIPRSVMPKSLVLKFLYDWGRDNKIVFVKFEPYVEKPVNIDAGLTLSNHPLFTPWTQILDLKKTEDELLAAMHQKTRYNIKLAIKKGVVVKHEYDDAGYETFSKLYFETTRRQKYYGHDASYHKTVWTKLKKGIAHIMTAYYGDIPLAAYELFYFKKRFYYVYGGTSSQHRNLMASNLLMWEAIKMGKSLGAESFDMWGSLPPDYDQSDPWAGFTRFKEGYGTRFAEMVGSYDLVIRPNYYHAYNLAYKMRETLLKLSL